MTDKQKGYDPRNTNKSNAEKAFSKEASSNADTRGKQTGEVGKSLEEQGPTRLDYTYRVSGDLLYISEKDLNKPDAKPVIVSYKVEDSDPGKVTTSLHPDGDWIFVRNNRGDGGAFRFTNVGMHKIEFDNSKYWERNKMELDYGSASAKYGNIRFSLTPNADVQKAPEKIGAYHYKVTGNRLYVYQNGNMIGNFETYSDSVDPEAKLHVAKNGWLYFEFGDAYPKSKNSESEKLYFKINKINSDGTVDYDYDYHGLSSPSNDYKVRFDNREHTLGLENVGE